VAQPSCLQYRVKNKQKIEVSIVKEQWKILMVEDELPLGSLLKESLQGHGYDVTWVQDGKEAIGLIQKNVYDLCLLDVNLPSVSGYKIANKVREKNEWVPIIFLSAQSLEEDILAGFDHGGDDYITKPFSNKELLKRIEVLLKRAKRGVREVPQSIAFSGYVLDCANLQLIDGGQKHSLTQREADLLMYIVQQANQVLKREDILLDVWGKNDYFLGRSMDVFMAKLRKYFSESKNVSIETIYGVGFRFNSK
jgi:DNA-binding response OmpR family regulator